VTYNAPVAEKRTRKIKEAFAYRCGWKCGGEFVRKKGVCSQFNISVRNNLS